MPVCNARLSKMAIPNFELERMQRDASEISGDRQRFGDLVRKRLERIIASASRKRSLGNAFGLTPSVQRQELLRFQSSEGDGAGKVWVAGERFPWGLQAAEDVVENIISEVAGEQNYRRINDDENPTIAPDGVSLANYYYERLKVPSLGIDLQRSGVSSGDPWNHTPLRQLWIVTLSPKEGE